MDGFTLLLVLLLTLGVTALLFRLFTPSGRAVARRQAELRRLASRLGLRYYGTTDPAIVELLPAFSLLQGGYARQVSNLIAEPRRPPRLLLFDHHATYAQLSRDPRPSEYDDASLHLVAMAALADGAEVTPARVYRRDWFGGPVGVSDLYRLQFPGDPAFGSYYLFAGEPREGVRRMFTAPVRDALANWSRTGPKPVVEIVAGWAIVSVETVVGDKDVAERAAALLNYTTGISAALGVAWSADEADPNTAKARTTNHYDTTGTTERTGGPVT
jgi:hypothetical protein